MNGMNLMSCTVRRLLVVAFGVASLAVFAQPAPDAPGPQDLRVQAKRLERQAQELKAQGQHDEAQKAMNQAEQLATRAKRLERQAEAGPAASDQPRPDLRAQLEQLQGRLKELSAGGQAEQAAEVQRRIQRLENALRSSPRRPGPAAGEDQRPLGPRQQPLGQGRGLPEMPERLRHLQVAIENLRAAGLPTAAERLARIGERMQQQLQRGPRPQGRRPSGPPLVEGDPAQLRQQVQDLRQAVDELRRRLDEMSRERR